jgi:membrane-associated phospholipid phosphatase
MTGWLHNMEWAIAIRSDALTPVFKAFSAMGYGGFYLLFLPIGYWAINKRIFTRLALLLVFSSLLNAYLKDLFQDPRPDPMFQLDPGVGTSFGFPSGHSQIAVTTWFWLAWEVRKRWTWALSVVLVAGICFSRLYLGVHDLEDVIGGIGIGLVLFGIFAFLNGEKFRWRQAITPIWQLVIIGLIEATFFLTWPGELLPEALGFGLFLLGFWVGVILDRKRLYFEKHPDKWRVIVSCILGIAVFIAVNKGFSGISNLFGNYGDLVKIILALVLGAYISALAPWMFQRLKLAMDGSSD